jgi:WD40 repeat protein/tetratricopeptide (TPR) repeat protein
VVWSPDSSTLATPGHDAKIYLWDAATGTRKASLDGNAGGVAAAFHPSGTLLASTSWDSRMRLWDPVLGRSILSLTDCSLAPEFSRDGRIVVSLEDHWRIHQVDPALEYRTLGHVSAQRENYEDVSIRHDGRVLAVGTSRGVALWDLARGTELAFLPIGSTQHLRFEASGDLLTSGMTGVQRWPIRCDTNRGQARIGPPHPLRLPVGGCGIDEDRLGRIVAKANHSRAYVQTAERAFHIGPLDDVRSVAVSPDGQWLATGSHGQTGAQVWRIRDAEPVAHLAIDGLIHVHFSPDGKWLMTSGPPCRLWAVGTWGEARQLGGVGMTFSPDGRQLVVEESSRALRLVETETGRTLARLEGPDACQVAAATFSPDGSRLSVTTNDGPAVHIWDLRAIRRQLAAMGLDWDAPAFSGDDPAGPTTPPLPSLQVDFGELSDHLEHYTDSPETLLQRHSERIAKNRKDAAAYHHRAHALVELNRLDDASDDLTQAIRLRPDDLHSLIFRAEIGYRFRHYEAAIADLEAALALDPEQFGVGEFLAECCNNLAWELANAPEPRRDVGRALAMIRRARAVAPDQRGLLNTLGVVQYRAGRYAEAITTLERSLAAGRGQSDGFDLFFLAMAHHRLGHRDQARDCFDRAVRWRRAAKSLNEQSAQELAGFRAEAEAVRAGPAGELPDDVFANPR